MLGLWLGLTRHDWCGSLLNLLATLFGCLLLLSIVASGFTMMFAPESAKRLLKNAALALLLFLLGSELFGVLCAASSALTRFLEAGMYLVGSVAASVAALILIGVAFVYPFKPALVLKSLGKLAAPFIGLLLLLMLAGPFAHSHPVASFIVMILISISAYVVRELRLGRRERPRKPGAAERKPVLPRG